MNTCINININTNTNIINNVHMNCPIAIVCLASAPMERLRSQDKRFQLEGPPVMALGMYDPETSFSASRLPDPTHVNMIGSYPFPRPVGFVDPIKIYGRYALRAARPRDEYCSFKRQK